MKRKIINVVCAILTILIWLHLVCTIVNILIDRVTSPDIEVYSKQEFEIRNSRVEEFVEYLDVSYELEHNPHAYDSYRYWIWEVKYNAIAKGVNYKVAVAISRLETGNYKSSFFVNCNNFGGIGSSYNIRKYKTKKEGLNDFLDLCKDYQDSYGLDIDKWSKKYCPPGDDWARAVKSIMKEVK